MAEKLCDLKTAGGDNWPDMTDATPMTVISGRASNITKNGIKKIGSDYYIEFEGDISIPFTQTGYSSVAFLNFPSSCKPDYISGGVRTEYNFEYTQLYNIDPYHVTYGFSLENMSNGKYNDIRAVVYNTSSSWTYTDSVSIRMIVHT